MADRPKRIIKGPDEILATVFAGHDDALMNGHENAKSYLVSYIEKSNSIPNAVKFFLYDLLAEDAYKADDVPLCREAVEQAARYFNDAKEESRQRLNDYLPKLRFIERGISVAVDAGEFADAIAFCDRAIAMDLGKAYMAKKASIERML